MRTKQLPNSCRKRSFWTVLSYLSWSELEVAATFSYGVAGTMSARRHSICCMGQDIAWIGAATESRGQTPGENKGASTRFLAQLEIPKSHTLLDGNRLAAAMA